MTTGTYLGNGTAGRAITGLGFKPDVVLIKGNDFDPGFTATSTVVRTSTMPAGLSKPMVLDNALVANQIQSLDVNGFTVGNDRRVNQAAINYYWAAFKVGPDMKVGTYTGNGGAQSIGGVGFSPDYVIVMSATARRAIHACSAIPTGSPSFRSYEFESAGWIANEFTSLDALGFSVTQNAGAPYANENGVTYHYVAWNAAPLKTFVGSYQGDAMDNRNITGVGFQPEYLLVKAIYNNNTFPTFTPPPMQKMAQIAGDAMMNFSNGNFTNNHIQALQADGFQIGNAQSINRTYAECNVDGPGCEYFYVAFNMTATNYRSIGTAAAYGTGTISVSNGSATVTGAGGAAWLTANRGRGDVITIPCTDPPACLNGAAPDGVHYTIQGVGAETSLLLTQGYTGATASGLTYLIRRQFSNLTAWEDCTDGPPGTACPYFPVTSASLVADDRNEVGIAYKDSVFTLTANVVVRGSTTDATHTIKLTADPPNRHNGIPGAGVVIDANLNPFVIMVRISNLTIEWLEFIQLRGANGIGAVGVMSQVGPPLEAPTNVLLQNLLVHNFLDATFNPSGIRLGGAALVGKSVTVRNSMIWDGDNRGIEGDDNTDALVIENCSVNGMAGVGIHAGSSTLTVRNTIAVGNPTADFNVAAGSWGASSSNNIDSDGTAPGANPLTALAANLFVTPGIDLHLKSGAVAIDSGLSLAPSFYNDIDGGVRPGGLGWDRGADEFGVTTEVRLQSFTPVAGDGSVLLEWRTASELHNLGFHLYRGLAESGPWTRLTTSLIPGLGSSATGQAYSYRDEGLGNGTRYYYRLEDVDAASRVTSHGPVSAVPLSRVSGGAPGSGPPASGPGGKKKGTSSLSCPDWVVMAYGSMAGASASSASLACTRHGNPEAVSLDVVSRDKHSATLELKTGGFYALREASGEVRVFVPGFDFEQDPQALALPVRRALVDAVVGRRVQLGGVRALDPVGFPGLVPAALGKAEMQVSRDGTVRAGRRALRELALPHVASDLVRLLPSVFQGETKSAVVVVAPLRYDSRRQQIVLSKRVLVKLLFTGRETGESGRGHVGRKERPQTPVSGELLARLYTTGRGLYAASFDQVFPGQRRSIPASELRLERQGQAVGFHLEPVSDSFGAGSVLYFHAAAAVSSTDFSSETAFELVRARDGLQMPLLSAAPSGGAVANGSTGRASFESQRFYQPGLLDAPDPWLWEGLASGTTRSKSFSLAGVDAASSLASEIEVFLQGASESGNPVDHHVSVSLNGVLVGEAQFAGKKPYRISLGVPVSLLREGTNELSLTNVADTGVSSLVFLDRFTISYAQASSLTSGVFEGTWVESSTAMVLGSGGPVALLDVTAPDASWLRGYEATGGALRFRAEAGHRYLAVSQQAFQSPRVAAPTPSNLRSTENQADYLLIAPRAFLTAAEPLLERRHDQGLQARAVAFEEVADEFGHGQPSAEAIRSFLAYAFHSWTRPSPRYVLLLGDATYDPRNFTGISRPSPLPALWVKTSYLWTVSDPQLAAVNGEDALPDLAIGRLPATTVSEANRLVEKLIAWEDSGQGLAGAAALVADNPDLGGDFDANVTDIAASYLAARSPTLLRLSGLGPATRPRILDALNAGLSLLSYVGHGGAAVWASENVWNSWDAPSLLAQSQQPLLLTMNCLNGYFVAPSYDSLAESLTKADGRGAIAAFSPSGLSLDGPAHAYHRALMAELTSGRHARLGDALTAAQKAYAQSGLMPELLSIYQLLGDPATRIR